MGFYIETPKDLYKALQLRDLYGAAIVAKPVFSEVPADKAVIVVVNNHGIFEAAGLAYSQEEFDAFTCPSDLREKTFVLMDKAVAYRLAGFRE